MTAALRCQVRTIIHVLSPEDRISIVAYSSKATLVLPLTDMTTTGRAKAETALKQLRPQGQTNLWDGLHSGLEVLRKGQQAGSARLSAVLLLTDGCPNLVPPRGHLPMLRRYKDSNAGFACTISTFGFGYELDSKLLNDLAVEGDGMYAFIPDSAFVGTAFVNAASNLLATMARGVEVSVEVENGCELVEEAEEPGSEATSPFTPTSWGGIMRLGSLQYGQSRDTVVRLKVPATSAAASGAAPMATVTLKYFTRSSAAARIITTTASLVPNDREVAVQTARALFVATVPITMQSMSTSGVKAAKAQVNSLVRSIKALPLVRGEPRVTTLLKDISGQVMEAVSRTDYYTRWGQHYLPSLRRSHALQQCNNFKDPGIQHYGGALFGSIRDKADSIFIKLPAPEPSRRQVSAGSRRRHSHATTTTSTKGRRSSGGASSRSGFLYAPAASSSSRRFSSGGRGGSRGGGSRMMSASAAPAPAPAPAPARSMAAYYNSSTPCFAGACSVALPEGASKRVDAVRRGDMVATPGGGKARVVCVVQTHMEGEWVEMVSLPGGMLVTPYHPVQHAGAWRFPCDVGKRSLVPTAQVPAVYSFVIDAAPFTMVINDRAVVCFAHGIKGDAVASHDYFGTSAVLRDLEGMRGWKEGHVELQPDCLRRDPATGRVCAMVQRGSTAATATKGVPDNYEWYKARQQLMQ